MAEQTINSEQVVPPEPELRRREHQPQGVLRKNLKPLIYLGATALVVIAALFSGSSKKTPSQSAAARHEPPQPTVQDNTDNNVQDLKNQLAAERQKEAQTASQPQTPNAALANATLRPAGSCHSLWPERASTVVHAGPALLATAAFLLSANKRSSWRQRSGNWLMIRDLHRILSIRARRTHRLNPVLM